MQGTSSIHAAAATNTAAISTAAINTAAINTAIESAALPARAAAPTLAVVRDIRPDQLDAATPCSDFNVHQLMEHLLFWGPALEAAARKEDPMSTAAVRNDPPTGAGQQDPRIELTAQIERIAAAWSDPAAWAGDTRMGSPMKLPSPLIGGMVIGELVVHGWDMARATGQLPVWDEEVLTLVYRELTATAEQGREMGVYGPRVPVSESGPLLDRILGLTGRNPRWTA